MTRKLAREWLDELEWLGLLPRPPRLTPSAMFMCKRHWFMLPKPMRDGIWATYRKGQEMRRDPSSEYLKNAIEAIRWLDEKERGRP